MQRVSLMDILSPCSLPGPGVALGHDMIHCSTVLGLKDHMDHVPLSAGMGTSPGGLLDVFYLQISLTYGSLVVLSS